MRSRRRASLRRPPPPRRRLGAGVRALDAYLDDDHPDAGPLFLDRTNTRTPRLHHGTGTGSALAAKAVIPAAADTQGVYPECAVSEVVEERHPDRPTAADVAVTVLDEWQGCGAAGFLLAALVEQCPPGVTELVTQVAVGNAASLAMLRRLGAVRVTGTGLGVHDVEVT